MSYPRLGHEELKKAQEETLATPRQNYHAFARVLFRLFDLLYGKTRTLKKANVLEIIARMPYQAWERRAYNVITRRYVRPELARRVFEFALEAREQQDNEQWHLLIIQELLKKKGIKQGFFRYRLLPQLIAMYHYWSSTLLYLLKPSESYRLNQYFEDHAEHEYMLMVSENPQWENEPWESEFEADYGSHESVADLFRQIGHDERIHKIESEKRVKSARYR